MGLAMGQMFGGMMGQQMGGAPAQPLAQPSVPAPPPPPMATTYHYNGAAGQGQFSAQQIAQHVVSNRSGTHNVWAQGWPNWQSWQQVQEIASLVPPAQSAPPPMPGVEAFHYNEDGQSRGEQPSNLIAQAVQANPNGHHLVWKQGMANWIEAKEVDAISVHLSGIPTPPPLTPGAGGPPPMP